MIMDSHGFLAGFLLFLLDAALLLILVRSCCHSAGVKVSLNFEQPCPSEVSSVPEYLPAGETRAKDNNLRGRTALMILLLVAKLLGLLAGCWWMLSRMRYSALGVAGGAVTALFVFTAALVRSWEK